MQKNEALHLLPPEAIANAPVQWVNISWWNTIHPDLCIYCHCQLDESNKTKDHLFSTWWLKRNVSFEFRKRFCVMNVAPCCAACNTRKGNRNVHEWQELKQLPGRRFLLKENSATYSSIIQRITRIFVTTRPATPTGAPG